MIIVGQFIHSVDYVVKMLWIFFCKWALDHSVNKETVFIARNSCNYDAPFIVSYPDILANGGKLLEMKIKTAYAKLIDSCCYITMP